MTHAAQVRLTTTNNITIYGAYLESKEIKPLKRLSTAFDNIAKIIYELSKGDIKIVNLHTAPDGLYYLQSCTNSSGNVELTLVPNICQK
jgi:hypothetical protein